jgi:large subunit ribosomal protein L24
MSKNKIRIRSGDTVVVVTGKDRGSVGKVLRVVPSERKIAVEGVRVVKRHQRGVGDQPGGIVMKEALLDVSNVAYWNAAEGRRVKLGYQVVDGKKVRVDRKTGEPVDKD